MTEKEFEKYIVENGQELIDGEYGLYIDGVVQNDTPYAYNALSLPICGAEICKGSVCFVDEDADNLYPWHECTNAEILANMLIHFKPND